MTEAVLTENAKPGVQASNGSAARKARTAVLVVHGMGSQRALDTVRGVVNAVWLNTDGEPGPDENRYWLHPERNVDDLDLSVITTSEVKDSSDQRSADFHELYWAHLMSETRAVAVLLWLFELVRKGPRLKRRMRALWWGATIFLCLLMQSVVLLALHAVLLFLGNPPLIDDKIHFGVLQDAATILLSDHPYHEPQALLLAPFFVLFMAASYAAFFALWRWAWKILIGALALAGVSGWLFYHGINLETLPWFTSLYLPILVSLCVAAIAMGRWGAIAMVATYLLSSCFFVLYLNARYLIQWNHIDTLKDIIVTHHGNILDPSWVPFSLVWDQGWIFWSLNERYSAVIAFAIIFIYLALYALFLQPYLGDAARYFRASPGNVLVRREIRKQAVDILDGLHKSGNYDRVVVVAHSLGTVVAYDMLRSYFSSVDSRLSLFGLEPELSELDAYDPDQAAEPKPDMAAYRAKGRALIRKIADQTVRSPDAYRRKLPRWLVTDFVTLGSPLTHAHYLMCDGNNEQELVSDFQRRVKQREFPVCPPERQGKDGVLLFENPNTGRKEFHQAALFGMTRWTNLFFPMNQMFWGDAIGGPLKGIFGRCIEDVPVSTVNPSAPRFFTHTSYWKTTCPLGRSAPQIVALRKAVDLKDS